MSKKSKKDEESESASSSESSGDESSEDESSDDEDSAEETSKKKPAKRKAPPKKAAKQKRGTKRKKDPKAPKRALTPYMFFMKDKRKEFKEKFPEKPFGELSREMSKAWHQMSDDDKKDYLRQTEEDKIRYQKAMENYTPPSDDSDSDSDDGKKKRPAKRQKKDPNAPKRAQNAYLFFQTDIRETVKKENPTLKMTEIAKKIGERWGKMSPEEKKPYEEKSAADKQRFAREMEAYKNAGKAEEEKDDDADDDE